MITARSSSSACLEEKTLDVPNPSFNIVNPLSKRMERRIQIRKGKKKTTIDHIHLRK